jgi:hypothetical protein
MSCPLVMMLIAKLWWCYMPRSTPPSKTFYRLNQKDYKNSKFNNFFVWSSLNNFRDISNCNYLISKPNDTSFLITISYPYNYFISFLIHHQHDMKSQINMCIFMFMIFILIEIKFDIDIHNDELLIIIWEHIKKENCEW